MAKRVMELQKNFESYKEIVEKTLGAPLHTEEGEEIKVKLPNGMSEADMRDRLVLETKRLKKVEGDFHEMRRATQALLVLPLDRRRGKAPIEIEYKKGYEPKHDLREVKFRNDRGEARFPGMDLKEQNPPRKQKKNKIKTTRKVRSKRKDASSKPVEVVDVVVPAFTHMREIQGVPYYQLAETVQWLVQREEQANKTRNLELARMQQKMDTLMEMHHKIMAERAREQGEHYIPPMELYFPADAMADQLMPPRLPHIAQKDVPPATYKRVKRPRTQTLAKEAHADTEHLVMVKRTKLILMQSKDEAVVTESNVVSPPPPLDVINAFSHKTSPFDFNEDMSLLNSPVYGDLF
jgi:hypothetical protein